MPKILIEFISVKLRNEFFSLKNGKYHEKQLYKFIKRALNDIQEDINCSSKIPKKLWPKEYTKYNIKNLFKYDLPNGWRLLFSYEQNNILIVALILEWLSHKDYEKRFRY